MLQPREKKTYWNKCIKPVILFMLFIAGFFLAFVPWFFIFIYFSMEKTSKWIKRNLTISEIIVISGITDCMNDFDIWRNSWTKTKIKYRDKSYSNQSKVSKKSDNNFYSLNKATNSEEFKKQSKKLQNKKNKSVLEKHWSIWDDYESVIDIMSKNNKKKT